MSSLMYYIEYRSSALQQTLVEPPGILQQVLNDASHQFVDTFWSNEIRVRAYEHVIIIVTQQHNVGLRFTVVMTCLYTIVKCIYN